MSFSPRRPVLRLGAVLSAVVCLVSALLVGMIASASNADATFNDRSPLASVTEYHVVPGGVQFTGWAFDPDAVHTPIGVYATVDHKWVRSTTANLSNSSLAKARPRVGALHGYRFVVPSVEGTHLFCVSAKNVSRGTNFTMLCRRLTLDYGPYGTLDYVTTPPGSVHVAGWVADNDAPTKPVTVTVNVDGTAHTVVANGSRPTLAKTHPLLGAQHGFDVSYKVHQGSHRVCVSGTNIGYGSNNSIGCRTVQLHDSPNLQVDQIGRDAGKLRVRGWAWDQDAPKTALTVTATIDGHAYKMVANGARADLAKLHPSAGAAHGFDSSYQLSEGKHTVCLRVTNVGYGSDVSPACSTVNLNFAPSADVTGLKVIAKGVQLTGWSTDPDTSAPIKVQLTVDGKLRGSVMANAKGATHSGHDFSVQLSATSGKHTFCAIGLNTGYGTKNSAPACQTVTLALKPFGSFAIASRISGSNQVHVEGWAIDPDTKSPLTLTVTVNGTAFPNLLASAARADVGRLYPVSGPNHGFSAALKTPAGEDRVCITAKNVGGGADLAMGCRVVNAVHPSAPTAPRSVKAVGQYTSATVSWTPPSSDGGAPWTQYKVTASPGGRSTTVGATATTATVGGLKGGTQYTFTVQAHNAAGWSTSGVSATVKTQTGPPPQRTPAPIATSRYIRNISGSSSAELARMRAEGVTDAQHNPSGHRYLVLLDIGGQDQYDGGVVLSATTRFVSYANLVRDLDAYVDGYASAQKGSAPVTIALGTNNDMDVSNTSGKAWAQKVVNPVRSHGTRSGLTIAGANDIEPGFRAGYSAVRNWLSGYLSGTSAQFVFNGSADGCAWTAYGRGCNNGWNMSMLYTLAGGAASSRIVNLPQVYNTTMSHQWKYISLTGVVGKHPRINFGGPLTEYTACAQSGGCGSLGGKSAWSTMWNDLQSDTRLRVSGLPYSTDLRVDR